MVLQRCSEVSISPRSCDSSASEASAGIRRQSFRMTESEAERRTELVRGARCQETHPDDVVLLGGVLTQRGEPRIAVAQIAVDPGHEHDEQHGIEHQADERAGDIHTERIAKPCCGNVSGR